MGLEIHELNTFEGTPGADNYLAIDNGSATRKISGEALLKGPNDRIANLIENVLPDSVETLYTDETGIYGTITLPKDVSNFDFLDLYFKDDDTYHAGGIRIPVSQFPVEITLPSQSASDKQIYLTRNRVSVSGASLTVSGRLWDWTGNQADAATVQSSTWVTTLVRVDGIKISSNTPAELTDIRVGYDGITYPSAGDAVRANDEKLDLKIDDLKSDLDYLSENPITKNVPVTAGWYINRSGVAINNGNQTLAISDFIRIPDGTYKFVGTKYSTNIDVLMYAVNFYDSSKVWLGGVDYISEGTIDASDFPDGAAYIRLGNYDTQSTPTHDQVTSTFYVFRINERLDEIAEAEPTINKNVIVNDIFTDKSVVKNTNIGYTNGIAETNANFAACNFIEVEPSTTYHVLRNSNKLSQVGNLAFYREDKTYISGQQSNWSDWTTPSNAKYVRFSVYIWRNTQDNFSFDGVSIVKGSTAKPVNHIGVLEDARYSPLYDKKWVGIGDSLTEVNARADLRYWNYIADANGLSFVNMGVGGAGYINRSNENKAFYQRALNMDTDADLITIFGGVNDCLFATAPIGEPTDSGTTTWCGCVNALIDNIRSLYLYAPLGIISPLPCDWVDGNNESQYDTQLPNDTTCRMSIFVDKLKTICALRGVPFLDLFHQSGMLPDDATFNSIYYSCGDAPNGDGLHPNSEGHKLFYRKIEKFLETLLAE